VGNAQLRDRVKEAQPTTDLLEQEVDQAAQEDTGDQEHNWKVLLVLVVEDGVQAGVHAVGRVHLQPEEEVVLVVGPYDLNHDAGVGDLRENHAVPDPVEQLEALLLMYCSALCEQGLELYYTYFACYRSSSGPS